MHVRKSVFANTPCIIYLRYARMKHGDRTCFIPKGWLAQDFIGHADLGISRVEGGSSRMNPQSLTIWSFFRLSEVLRIVLLWPFLSPILFCRCAQKYESKQARKKFIIWAERERGRKQIQVNTESRVRQTIFSLTSQS